MGGSSPFHSLYSNEKNGKYLEIKCISFKDIFDENKIERCDILKMDCEGAEFEIFYNTPGEYFKKIKEIRMEYHNIDENNNIKRLTEFLEGNGFVIVELRKDPNIVVLRR